MIFKNPDLDLDEQWIRYGKDRIHFSEFPNPLPRHPLRLQGATPILERLWLNALCDIESNIVEQDGVRYFGAGKIFGPAEFTRDIAISGILGLNRLYPEPMRSSLEFTRRLRLKIGLTVSADHVIHGIPCDVKDKPEHELRNDIGSASMARRTDDVVWLWCAGDLLKRKGSGADWEWLYDLGRRCFNELYNPFYDNTDGLYFGQSCFVDITYTEPLRPHFCSTPVTGYPLHYTASECVHVKALSTNCLYFRALLTMAEAAVATGCVVEAAEWETRAENLKSAILRTLKRPDGTFAYYKGPDGILSDKRDAFGSALAVLFEVVTGEEAIAALTGYPVTPNGVPLFYPFFPGNHFYHNNSSWPFVETFFLKALEKADGSARHAQNAALLARTCNREGTFYEVMDLRDNSWKGSTRQLWTAAAFIEVCDRAGYLK